MGNKIERPVVALAVLPIVRLTKLKESDNPLHPDNIATGFVIEGSFFGEPIVDEAFWVGSNWRTSGVQEILSENTFRTFNSIYKWEIIKER